MKGIMFNDQHSFTDLGLTLKSKNIGYPKKVKKLIDIPYTNIQYDMSELYGSQEYENRTITYVFNVFDSGDQDKISMDLLRTNLVNAYMTVNNLSPLFDDDIPDYYFLAEVRNNPSSSEKNARDELEIVFDAYPFRIAENKEGGDEWDVFNFLTDIAQFYSYYVSGILEITMDNVGGSGIMPTIVASSDFTIVLNNQTFKVKKGESTDLDFRFETGTNRLKIVGFGELQFLWYREVI